MRLCQTVISARDEESQEHDRLGVRERHYDSTMVRIAPMVVAVVVGFVLVVTPAAVSLPSAGNLLQNGDAEGGAGATGNDVIPPPGWTTTGAFTAGRYGATGLPPASPGGGSNLFAGGPGEPLSTATQTVNVSSSSASIDAGQVRATLAALLGGWEGQEDSANVEATFLSGSGGVLGSVTIGPVTAADRGGKSVLLPRSSSGAVVSGTRSIRVVITARRSSGIYNDGYSDNVSLTLGPGSAPPTGGSGQLVLSYTTPARFGLDANHDGLVDYVTTPAQVSPRGWTAVVEVRRKGRSCDPTATYTWTIDGRAAAFEPTGTCLFTFEHFPQLRAYAVGVTAQTAAGKAIGSAKVELKDYLIAGLGDSNGSGEGNPDIPGLSVRWQDLRCDRSVNSFQAQAALGVEQRDKKTSVTFVHLACSGASIPKGMVGPYRGINDPGGAPIESQVSQLQRLIGGRKLNALLISIGVNDLGFSDIVSFCLNTPDCPNQPFEAGASLDDVAKERLAALPGRFDQLAARLNRLKIPPSRVFITAYFDSTRDAKGNFCDPLMSVVGGKIFSRAEAEWAYESLLAPLNREVLNAALKRGWTAVWGAAQRFHTHGYCSSTPWIVGLVESLRNQHSKYGTLHANLRGHRETASLVLARLRRAGIPG